VVFAAYNVAISRAYLTSENGVVVLYKGVPGSFAGITLSTRAQETTIAVTDLDYALQSRLRSGLPMPTLADAERALESYRQTIAEHNAPAPAPSTVPTGTLPSVP
jgi:protein phosphatase